MTDNLRGRSDLSLGIIRCFPQVGERAEGVAVRAAIEVPGAVEVVLGPGSQNRPLAVDKSLLVPLEEV